MDIIRRNTDYAFRLAAAMAADADKCISGRKLAADMNVPYQLACKLLQRLAAEGLAESVMGPKGGYRLAKDPSEISFKDVIEAIQGPVTLNMCLSREFFCPLREKCPMNEHLAKLQQQMDYHLSTKTLAAIVNNKPKKSNNSSKDAKKASKNKP